MSIVEFSKRADTAKFILFSLGISFLGISSNSGLWLGLVVLFINIF